MNLGPFRDSAPDLASGDRSVQAAEWGGFRVDAVRAASDPDFEEGWGRLWREFGGRGEMETRAVIAGRLAWDPARPLGGWSLLYEMLVVRREGRVVAVRDHSAILAPDRGAVVVHLSHVLVEPELRGSGLAGWLRALPVDAGRRCARRAGAGSGLPVTLVAEMEEDDGVTPAVVRRLRSYAKAGFSLADPSRVHYHQPDLRPAEEIDAGSSTPVPLSLVLRRVGRESERSMDAAELAVIVDALYAMYGLHVRGRDIAVARRAGGAMPARGERIELLVPGNALREGERG